MKVTRKLALYGIGARERETTSDPVVSFAWWPNSNSQVAIPSLRTDNGPFKPATTIYHRDALTQVNPLHGEARQCLRAVMVWSCEKWWWYGFVKNEILQGEGTLRHVFSFFPSSFPQKGKMLFANTKAPDDCSSECNRPLPRLLTGALHITTHIGKIYRVLTILYFPVRASSGNDFNFHSTSSLTNTLYWFLDWLHRPSELKLSIPTQENHLFSGS